MLLVLFSGLILLSSSAPVNSDSSVSSSEEDDGSSNSSVSEMDGNHFLFVEDRNGYPG